MATYKKQCIIKSSLSIRSKILQRIRELDLTNVEICEEAEKFGRKIGQGALSRYLKHGAYKESGLSQENIIWVCVRYSIDIKLKVTLQPYNEEMALKRLEKTF